ncbi:MAG TPA: Gfo/Idh/MocA family oxidoreductase [Candidatus Paceibacterota bacterium]|nr:Gfo/Idh/MocA family oxidoreductase [Candidatus Paceibacterota bacterium]
MNKRITFRAGLTRRSFLQRSGVLAGAALAGPLIVPARVLGLEGKASPANRITIGFIGTGRQAIGANIPGFLNEDDAQAVAVCDADSWRMEHARKQIETHYAQQQPSGGFKGCATFHDWRDLLARKDIDAVMISTPDHWHVLMAMAAANAGKDIACEKPLTRSIAEGRKLANLVAERKIVFRTDSEYRSRKFYFQAVQLVRNGKIGKLERVVAGMRPDPTLGAQPDMPVPEELDYDMWLGPAPQAPYTEKRVHNRHDTKSRPGWMCIRDYDDGMIANWGAHLHDMALWAMDLDRSGPTEVEGTGKYPPAGNLWNVIQEFEVRFTFANGVQLTSKSDTSAYVRFEGSEGWIHVHDSGRIEAEPKSLLSWKPGPGDLALTYKRSEKRDFLDSVKTRERSQEDAEVGHRNSTLCHLAVAAIDSGRKIKWDPAREQVIGDAEASRLLEPKPYRSPWKL